jgi:hypothetical protein
MIDVASRVKIVPLIRMKVLCYAPSKGRPLFQRRVSPFDPLRLSFDVRKHGFKAFEGARIGMLGLLDILATEKEETEPLPAPLWIRNKSRIMTLRLPCKFRKHVLVICPIGLEHLTEVIERILPQLLEFCYKFRHFILDVWQDIWKSLLDCNLQTLGTPLGDAMGKPADITLKCVRDAQARNKNYRRNTKELQAESNARKRCGELGDLVLWTRKTWILDRGV